jgi:pimeloyl-ACP methyl ester carboxylesterase
MKTLTALLIAALVTACGGGGSTPATTPVALPVTPPPPPARGSLVDIAELAPVTIGGVAINKIEPSVLALLLNELQAGTTAITGMPSCAITTYKVRYNALGAVGEQSEASAAVMIPSGSSAACSGERPVLLYAHATSVEKTFDMSALAAHQEARLVAAMFAAQGYIVVAPNYAGYAGSTLGYHPYLDADQQSGDMVDALRAARLSFSRMAVSASNQLLVAGYSQGGHVALATVRAMQTQFAAEFNVTAAAGMSGPYALAQFADSVFGGAPRIGATVFVPLLVNAGQRAGAGLYATPGELFEPAFANGIAALLPGVNTLEQLSAKALLPASALFARDSMPQGADSAQFFGDGNLIKTSYRNAYLADLAANPCKGVAADPLACTPQHPLRKLARKHDLRLFVPAAPVLLCGGEADPTVPFFNTDAAAATWRAKGATTVTVVNIDDVPGLGDPYRTSKLSFATAKLAVRSAALADGKSPSQAVESNYHAGLVAPFCMMATRDYFDAALRRPSVSLN